MELSKFNEMVFLESIIKEASTRRDILKGDCKDELLEAYERDGATQKRSKLFGKEAAVLSVVFSKAKEPVEVTDFMLTNDEAFAGWLEENTGAAISYVKVHASDFARVHLEGTGELPDGIACEKHMTEAVPEKVTGVRLSVKPEKVFEAVGISFEDGIRGLLPGDAS